MRGLQRLGMTVKSLAGELLAPAEDPRVTYASAYQHHDALVAQVRQAIQQLARARARSQRAAEALRVKLPALEDQARRAVAAGQDELARVLLKRRQIGLSELALLDGQLREIEAEEQRLRLVEQQLTGKIERMRSRLEMAALKYAASEAQVRVSESLTGLSREGDSLGQTVAEAEGRAGDLEARAAAIDSLIQRGTLPFAEGIDPGLQDSFSATGERDDPVELALAQIRRELAGEGEPSTN